MRVIFCKPIRSRGPIVMNFFARQTFLAIIVTVFVTVFFLTGAIAASPLYEDDENIFKEIIDAYTLNFQESGFWSYVSKNKEYINTSIIEKIVETGIAKKDETLIKLGLETARMKEDRLALAKGSLQTADYYLFLSNNKEALKLYDRALSLFHVLEDLSGQAKAYEGKGDIAFSIGNNKEAAITYDKALDLYIYANDSIGQGTIYRKLGDISLHTGDNEKARSMYQRTLIFLSRKENLIAQGDLYRSMGNMYLRKREYAKATSSYNRALIYYTHGQYPTGQADVYRAMGKMQMQTGKNEKAMVLYEKARPIYVEAKSLIGQGDVEKGLAEINYDIGNNVKALEQYEKAFIFYSKADYPLGIADVYRGMGQIQVRMGMCDKGSALFEKALTLYRKIIEPLGEGSIYKGFGDIAYSTMNFAEALNMYDKALVIYRKIDEPLGQGNVYRGIGDIFFYAGDNSQAMECYEKALLFYAKVTSPVDEANTYRSMGDIYRGTGNNNRAIEMYNKALSRYYATNQPIFQGNIYRIIGEMYQQKNNYEGALNMYEEALNIIGKTGSTADEGHIYQNTGDLFLITGDDDKALGQYEKSLLVYRRMEDKESEAYLLMKMASLSGKQEKVAEAMALYEEALAGLEKVRSRPAFSQMRKNYTNKVYDYYEDAVLFMLEHKENTKAFQYIEVMKARVFLDQLAKAGVDLEKGIDKSSKEERDAIEKSLVLINKKLLEEYQKTEPEEKVLKTLQTSSAEMAEKLEAVKRMIRYKNPLYASVQYPEPITLTALQKNILNDKEVIIEYFLSRDHLYCFVIGNKQYEVIELPINRANLEKKVKDFLKNIAGHIKGIPFAETQAADLYMELVKPLEGFLENKTVIIIPYGVLTHLPFDALITESDGERTYMIEQYSMKYVQSATMLNMLRTQYKRRGLTDSFIGFGDPVYDYESIKEGLLSPNMLTNGSYLRSGGSFARLEDSEDDIRTIAEIFTDEKKTARTLQGIDANEEQAKTPDMEQYAYIHFAAQCILNKNFQAIALSHSPESPDDGLLTLGEIMNSSYKANLVTLPACKTSLGEMDHGEGITGLTRAVMYAGSPAAVVSLWNVSSEGASALMAGFYENMLKKGLSKEEALRLAKTDLMGDSEDETFHHPFFWSGFVMYGE
ncbi:MAG: hypothetical protein C0399_00405 [Syntrophus sp. (in: bacteria)]|nr:hypothetical protein [Syntrophus sp. (in: bacteria)]